MNKEIRLLEDDDYDFDDDLSAELDIDAIRAQVPDNLPSFSFPPFSFRLAETTIKARPDSW